MVCYVLTYFLTLQVNLEPQGKIHLIVDLEQGNASISLL